VHKTLEEGIAKAVEADSYKDVITSSGNLVVYKNSADFTAFAESEAKRFAELIGS
jgi:tripartite-type tricarboxylate transporter receptor subunit TctC